MAISLGSNLSLHTRLVLDDRTLMDSILEMRDYPENFLPDIAYCFVKEDGKMYVFNRENESTELTGKWREYGSGIGTDEKVKLTSTSTDAKYLNELIDNSTIEVDTGNECLVVKKIDGQTATVAEINFLAGVTANVQEQINNLGKSMTMYGVFSTKADLLASVSPAPVDGNTAIVIADEDNNGKQMTYIYIASNSAWTQVAESSVTVRDFTTNPIDLDTETTGTLSKDKIDAAIARLADVLDKTTYQGSGEGIVKQADMLTGLTSTITALNQAITDSHTHTNKTALDKIISTGLGNNFLADNGKYISILSVGVSAPAYTSQIWIDTTNVSKPILKIYDGTNWIAVSGGTSETEVSAAEDITYDNPNFVQYDTVDTALDALFAKVYYVKPTCSLSADKRGGTFEMGTVISAPITFTWTTNKNITSQTLTGCTLADASVRTATYNTNVASNKTFTLSVSDGENFASSSVSYKFLNKILWGNSTEPTTYNSKFILALSNNKLASSNKGAFSFNCSDGEYAYFAAPTSMKITSAWVNGFQADLEEVAVVNHQNSSGYTSSYTITRFSNSGLGSFSATVQ